MRFRCYGAAAGFYLSVAWRPAWSAFLLARSLQAGQAWKGGAVKLKMEAHERLHAMLDMVLDAEPNYKFPLFTVQCLADDLRVCVEFGGREIDVKDKRTESDEIIAAAYRFVTRPKEEDTDE